MKKIKTNWGTAVVLAFIGFITFIMSFVIRMNTEKKYDHQLVTEAYYARELSFQQDMDREQRTHAEGMEPRVEQKAAGIYIYFPEQADMQKITGKVSFYRPSDRAEDFEVPITLTETFLLVPAPQLLPGRWNLEIDWQYGDDRFLTHKKIMY
ncbi:FixH family protein [Sinomicrobium pectinilyticum]|uniref:FixH family protein n=1 Tax=Sinomicrobium pectinilyticum TaxID=1084421 RepID=UPI001F0BAA4D|nr:FixH family protein [Sinomicrobium pectinilyticum]